MDQEPAKTEVETIKPVVPAKPARKGPRRIVLLWLLVALLMAVSAGAAYWYRDKTAATTEAQQAATITSLEKTNAALKKQLANEKEGATIASDLPACTAGTKTPTAATIENIKASVTSGNTAALEGYMASSVNVIFAASDGLGARTPTQAVSDITGFIGDPTTTTWNFALSSTTLGGYANGDYKQYFASSSVVGKSSTNKVIAFSFDCNAKISTVFMSASADIL